MPRKNFTALQDVSTIVYINKSAITQSVAVIADHCPPDYETVGILPLISRKTLGILGDGGA